jgi:hypothetical protein
MYILTDYRLIVTKYRPDLSSERSPYRDKTGTFIATSGHKSQSGLDTKTY